MLECASICGGMTVHNDKDKNRANKTNQMMGNLNSYKHFTNTCYG
jgi:hypothetical protein